MVLLFIIVGEVIYLHKKYTFKRVEKKYYITSTLATEFLERIQDRVVPDEYGKSTVNNLYLDTPDFLLIRNSMDAVCYKEKLRIRSYNTPKESDGVFLEIKKKFKGVVFKRRIYSSLENINNYLNTRIKPIDTQIMREIDYFLKVYNYPIPKMMISYDRQAYFLKDNTECRITFDSNLLYRDYDLDLTLGTYGKPIIPKSCVIMEIKTDGAVPLWLSNILSEMNIMPSRFSKYANAYIKKRTL